MSLARRREERTPVLRSRNRCVAAVGGNLLEQGRGHRVRQDVVPLRHGTHRVHEDLDARFLENEPGHPRLHESGNLGARGGQVRDDHAGVGQQLLRGDRLVHRHDAVDLRVDQHHVRLLPCQRCRIQRGQRGDNREVGLTFDLLRVLVAGDSVVVDERHGDGTRGGFWHVMKVYSPL